MPHVTRELPTRCVVKASRYTGEVLSPDAGDAYAAIAGAEHGLNADELAEKLAWPVQRTAASLFELEVSALVGTQTGRYVIK